MKSLLAIATLIISFAAVAKTPVSEYQVKLFKNEAAVSSEKLYCMFCDKFDRQIARSYSNRNSSNNKNYLTLNVKGQQLKVEVVTFNLEVIGEEKAKELGFDGSATPSFLIEKNGKIVSNNTSLNGNNLSKSVSAVLNEIATEIKVVEKRRESSIPTLWELKVSGQFNY